MMKLGLRYVGNGSLHGIPAGDLSIEEVKKYGGEDYLISTGLYAKPMTNKNYIGGKENKEVINERD